MDDYADIDHMAGKEPERYAPRPPVILPDDEPEEPQGCLMAILKAIGLAR
jgi:hypothetical protein